MPKENDEDDEEQEQELIGEEVGIGIGNCELVESDIALFKDLLQGNAKNKEDDSRIMKYRERLDIIEDDINKNGGRIKPGSRSVFIEMEDLNEYDSQLHTKLENNPISVLRKMTEILNEVFLDIYPEMNNFEIKIRINMVSDPKRSGFDDLDASKIGKMITLRGVITMITTKMPSGKIMIFKCPSCNAERKIEYNDFLPYTPPPKVCPSPECPSHGSRNGTAWNLEIYESRYANFQSIIIQEGPEFLGQSDQPGSCKIILTDDLVEMVKAGSRAIISGVLMATPSFKVYAKSFDPPVMRLQVHCTGVKIENADKSISEIITKKREKEIVALIKSYEKNFDGYFDFLTSGIAPMIYGHKWVKLALLLALEGGQLYTFPGNTSRRKAIHVFVMGDPGIAKTRLLKALEFVSPKYRYATGNQATAAGLTAAAIKPPNGVPELHIGAAVLADGGILAVDEFNQMQAKDKPYFLEFMETGTISIDKFGFHEKMNARTTVVAAANPPGGRVNMTPGRIKDNFKEIYPPLLNRFDFIFLIEDKFNRESEFDLVEKMLSSLDPKYVVVSKKINGEESVGPGTDVLEMQQRVTDIRDILTITRKIADEHPISISKDAKNLIRDYYLGKRERMVKEDGKMNYDMPIPISPRQLEGITRASEGFAILRTSKVVEPCDVREAMKLVDESMKEVMTDEDGNQDANILDSKEGYAAMNKEKLLIDSLNFMQKDNEKKGKKFREGIEISDMKEMMLNETKNLTEDLFDLYLSKAIKKGLIEQYQGTKIRLTDLGKPN